MPRNDGIGGTPRLARYTSIGTPPNRPPLPRRTPGETDINQDPRFRLVGARASTPAPAGSGRGVVIDLAVLERAREIVSTHLPSRLAECRVCNSAALCEPFTKALAVLRRHDPGKARRVMAVLCYAGLWPPTTDDDAGDHAGELPGGSGTGGSGTRGGDDVA
ncbi:hypothetical protein [Micromonospora sp. NBC_01813]|uniref:hypothetical protein n=1 Tax=Micromonospora sp. NBC_01813 TaxID=2975988 RepID=UPI002DDB2D97|nr:hypothetical protein [Micromonospora sp. NBC_01813]WSA12188.1 hypothetical protein OG958_16220 [Micromonospora sp. NBC_01813]